MSEVDYKELKKMVKAVNKLGLVDKIKFVAVKKEDLEEDFCTAVETIYEEQGEDALPEEVIAFYEDNFVDDADPDGEGEETEESDNDLDEEGEEEEDQEADEESQEEEALEEEEEKPDKKGRKKERAKKSGKKKTGKAKKGKAKKGRKPRVKGVVAHIMEFVCENPDISNSEIKEKLSECGFPKAKLSTISLQRNLAKKVIECLDSMGKLK